MTLTALEIEGLQGIYESEFQDCYGRETIGRPVWSWSANPFDNARQFAAIVTNLQKKGLVVAGGSGKDACVSLTAAGYAALFPDEAAP